MPIHFDDDVGFEGTLLIGWANVAGTRIRCVAGRETTNDELPGFTHATAGEIRNRKREIFNLLKPVFRRKIEAKQIERTTIPTVTIYSQDLHGIR
jgi:hypothetical protein